MGDLGDLLDTAKNQAEQAARKPKADHPKGWEPGVVWNGTEGTVTSRPTDEQDPRWDTWLTSWGFDPNLFEIVEPVQVRTWDAPVGNGETKQLWYYRASIRSRPEGHRRSDIDDIAREVMRWKCKPRPNSSKTCTSPQAFVVNVADVQMGKSDGDGVEGTVRRWLDAIGGVRDRYRELRKIGRTLSTLVVADVGDSTEGCYGNYPGQEFMVGLNQRDQAKLYRRLLAQSLRTWAPDFDRVVVLGVPSNHTENRQGGKRATDDGDDSGLANLECLAEAFSENPQFSHLSFVIPTDEMVVVLDLEGTTVAFTHAHKAERGGGLPQAKVKTWWANQSFSEQPVGDAEVLVSAHFHHYSVIDHGPKLHVQCPSMDGGSKWFQDATGAASRSGMLTFVTGSGARYTDEKIV